MGLGALTDPFISVLRDFTGRHYAGHYDSARVSPNGLARDHAVYQKDSPVASTWIVEGRTGSTCASADNLGDDERYDRRADRKG